MATKARDAIGGTAARQKRAAECRAVLYFMLHGFGFVGTTLLLTWGLFVLFFLAIGGFAFDGMVHQLHNFTTRYLAADSQRTGTFLNILAIAHMILSTAVITFRRDKILPEPTQDGAR